MSAARALAAADVPVFALGASVWDAVRHSRACREYFRAEGDAQHEWFAWLERNRQRLGGAVLVPCGDDGLELVARRRLELAELGYLAVEADDDVVLALLDKNRTYELARKIGVRTPRTLALADYDDPIEALGELGFPCALKPVHSHAFARTSSDKAIVVEDAREAEAALGRVGGELPMLVTEIVEGGPDRLVSYYTYVAADGEPLFHLTKRKLRQYPVLFGTESYALTEWHRDVAELGLRFVTGIGLRGLAVVEFKRDARDGELRLMECNHRLTGSHELILAAGINLALLVYCRAAGRPDPPLGRYRDGVRLWHPLADVHAFTAMRRTGTISTAGWLRSVLYRQRFPVFRASDPMPTIADLARRTRSFFRSVTSTSLKTR